MSHIDASPLKITIINKSDSTGGAAVVSYRLMEALRMAGTDTRMIVTEKLSDSPYVTTAASPRAIKTRFLLERLKIFAATGFNRDNLFKIDTGESGLPLWNHPWVKETDAILLNWVNQGMLSLKGYERILELGKPVIWTMHDMWCMTGICHHSAGCERYKAQCGECPLLMSKASTNDLSHKVWTRKEDIYSRKELMRKTAFVAVSSWLAKKAEESSLLRHLNVEVIPNAFQLEEVKREPSNDDKIRILFGAARIDDPIKGLDTLREATMALVALSPEISGKMELALFGAVKDPDALEGFGIPVRHLGVLKGEEVSKAYLESDIVVSASSYETLPGTMVEAQAYGCIPVSFNQGGQRDIITHHRTGYIADYDENSKVRAKNLAEGILWASGILRDSSALSFMKERMKESVNEKFSPLAVAQKYIRLISALKES